MLRDPPGRVYASRSRGREEQNQTDVTAGAVELRLQVIDALERAQPNVTASLRRRRAEDRGSPDNGQRGSKAGEAAADGSQDPSNSGSPARQPPSLKASPTKALLAGKRAEPVAKFDRP